MVLVYERIVEAIYGFYIGSFIFQNVVYIINTLDVASSEVRTVYF